MRIAFFVASGVILMGSMAHAADGHYASKADAKAGRLTPGAPRAARAPGGPTVGGEACATATPITTLPFNDSDNTTGHVDDNSALPAGCSDYTVVAGPDLLYSFSVGAANSVSFTATPTDGIYDVAIYVLGTCGNNATCVSGADATLGGVPETIPAQAYAAGTHAFYVDSFYAAGAACPGQGNTLCGTGTYDLAVTGSLPVELLKFKVE